MRTPADIHLPLQDRSRATLEKILDATEDLLRDRVLDDISIAEIMERADMAVGTFYRRFKTKEALLPYLYARYDHELGTQESDWLAPENWTGLNLEERAVRVAELAVRTYRERRGLWRAVLVRSVAHPESVSDDQRRRRRRLVRRLADLLAECADEIQHPDPALAAEMGIVVVMAVCKDKILTESRGQAYSRRLSDRRLALELARVLLGYLGREPRGR